MSYDYSEIRERVGSAKDSFVRRTVIDLILILTALIIYILYGDDVTVSFFCIVCGSAVLVCMLFRIFSPQSRVLFSGELTGVNVKEHEYVANARSTFRLGGKGAHTPRPKYTGVTGQGRTRPRTSAVVYLRLEDGNVISLGGLVISSLLDFGGNRIDESILNYIKKSFTWVRR